MGTVIYLAICLLANSVFFILFLSDCGAVLEGPSGNFASPNWPRNYEHHATCTWSITVSKFKVIYMYAVSLLFVVVTAV